MGSTILLACALSLGAAPFTATPADIGGDWRLVSIRIDGQMGKIPPGLSFAVRGNRAWAHILGFVVEEQCLVGFGTAGKHRTFDMLDPKGRLAGKGICRVEGNRLTICVSKKGTRPDDFSAKKGSGRQLMVLAKD